jgi:hypothetical protein
MRMHWWRGNPRIGVWENELSIATATATRSPQLFHSAYRTVQVRGSEYDAFRYQYCRYLIVSYPYGITHTNRKRLCRKCHHIHPRDTRSEFPSNSLYISYYPETISHYHIIRRASSPSISVWFESGKREAVYTSVVSWPTPSLLIP